MLLNGMREFIYEGEGELVIHGDEFNSLVKMQKRNGPFIPSRRGYTSGLKTMVYTLSLLGGSIDFNENTDVRGSFSNGREKRRIVLEPQGVYGPLRINGQVEYDPQHDNSLRFPIPAIFRGREVEDVILKCPPYKITRMADEEAIRST